MTRKNSRRKTSSRKRTKKSRKKGMTTKYNDFETELIQKLSREYVRYRVVQKLLLLERNPLYIVSLERVLILMANHIESKRQDEVFVDVPISHEYYEPLYTRLTGHLSFLEIQDLITKIKI